MATSANHPIKKITLFMKINYSFFDIFSFDDNEVAIVSTKFDNFDDGNSSMKILGIVKPLEHDLSVSNWFHYDITELITPEINDDQLITIQSHSFKIKSSFITIEYDYENVSYFCCLCFFYISKLFQNFIRINAINGVSTVVLLAIHHHVVERVFM